MAPLLRGERTALIELLATLGPEQWSTNTECPEWSVAGIARHLLGDDLSLLSRQRDDATNGLLLFAEDHPGTDFRGLLDGFNQQFVTASRFLSPALTIELLRLCGEWTSQYYETVDPYELGEPVPLFGATDTSPFWQIIAREYLERWAHHLQIRRALGERDLDARYLLGAIDVVACSLAIAMSGIDAPEGRRIGLAVAGLESWTFDRSGGGWTVGRGRSGESALRLELHRDEASTVLSRGLPAEEVWSAFTVDTGDDGGDLLVEPIQHLFSRVMARP